MHQQHPQYPKINTLNILNAGPRMPEELSSITKNETEKIYVGKRLKDHLNKNLYIHCFNFCR